MIYMAHLSAHPDQEQARRVKGWASQPWETNYELLNPAAVESDVNVFSSTLISKFCSDAVSPSQQILLENQVRYMEIKENGQPDRYCAHQAGGSGLVDDLEECMQKALDQDAHAFT